MGKQEIFNCASVLLDENAAPRRDKVAIYCGNEQVTYGELLENVNRFANVLGAIGIKPTERVMIHLPDSPMWFYAFLGSIKYGAWPVPVNTMLTVEDYEYLLADSEARLLITEKGSKASQAKTERLCYRLYADSGLDTYLANVPKEAKEYPSKKDDIAFWLYSSGSTGRPKGVPHRHIDMVYIADTYAKTILNINENDICFSVSKLFFAYGLGNGLAFPLRFGASVVQLPLPPTPENIIETVSTFKPTVFYGVPTSYNSILKKMKGLAANPFKSVRVCTSAGEPLPPEIFKRWKKATGLEILDGVGSTEVLHIYISNAQGDIRPGTSGRVVPGYEVKIVDDAGNEVPEGEAGHLLVRGESVTRGYWQRPETNAERFMDGGWFDTGDMYSQKDGYYQYQGRSDDMIKVGGIWVSPIEIENVLLQHKAVNEVAVVAEEVEGLSKPFAYITLNDKEPLAWEDKLKDDILQFGRERLPKYKWPWGLYFVEDLPKTATGKIQRFRLRKAEVPSAG